MRARIVVLDLSVFLGGAVGSAQNAPQNPPANPQIDFSTVNCSGFVADQHVPDEIRIVSGEQSNYKITFARGGLRAHQSRPGPRVFASVTGSRLCGRTRTPTDVPWFQVAGEAPESHGHALCGRGTGAGGKRSA